MNVFDIIGPIMIGPSSSHTAGACRLGNYARALLCEDPKDVTIKLSGSFKRTYKGHGTDKAIVAGLLGYPVDDIRLKDSMEIAKKEGRNFKIVEEDIEFSHPNTVYFSMKKSNGEIVIMQGASVGGGNIVITKINNTNVSIKGLFDTIVVMHKDVPGMVHKITKVFSEKGINISELALQRIEKHEEAVLIIEVDNEVNEDVVVDIKKIENVKNVTLLKALS